MSGRESQNQKFVGAASGGGEADGTELAGAVAQHVFRAIGAAADDVQTVFGGDAADVAALFLVWALAETERCVGLPLPHSKTKAVSHSLALNT